MKKVALLIILLACSLMSRAQQEDAQQSGKRVEYKTADGQQTPAGPDAAYRQETEATANGGEVVRTFYLSGKPRSVAFFEDDAHQKAHGVSEFWYETGGISGRSTYEFPNRELDEHFYRNGQLHFRRHFVEKKRQGELLAYYSDGKLKRQEIYADNQFVSGTLYDREGRELPYTPFEAMPVYPGGQEALLAHVRENTRYPAQALRQGQEGEVRVKFVVDTTGQVGQVRIGQGASPLLNEEALRVVRGFARYEPARQDDRPVTVYFTVPIKFAISPPRQPRKNRDQPL